MTIIHVGIEGNNKTVKKTCKLTSLITYRKLQKNSGYLKEKMTYFRPH